MNSTQPLARTNTFGKTNLAVPTAQPMARSGSPVRTSERPALQRATTPQPKDVDSDSRDIFTTGMFSDPPVERRWGMGTKVFTEGHQRLIFLLREEAARLYSYNQDLRAKNTVLIKRERTAEISDMVLRTEVRALTDKLEAQGDELKAAQAALGEMDALMATAQNKRLSRVMPKQYESLEHAMEGGYRVN